MRPKRTADEDRIIERLDEPFQRFSIRNPVIDQSITDAPDVVIDHELGRLGIEICRLDYEEYCKWLNTAPAHPHSRAAEVTMNLNKMLGIVMRKKKSKYKRYKHARGLNKCWLVLHNNLFEVKDRENPGHPDREWFEEISAFELSDRRCPYDRVLFNLEHPNIWYSLFDKSLKYRRSKVITRWPTIIFRQALVQMGAGEGVADLSDNVPKDTFS